MAIAQTATKTQAADANNPVTMAFDCNGGNLLVVGIACRFNPPSGTPTYNAVNMTASPEGTVDSTEEGVVQLWYLVNPAVGSNTISIPNAATAAIVPIASAWSGVDTADPLDTSNSDHDIEASATNPSVMVTTSAINELIIDILSDGDADISVAHSHTLISSQDNGSWNSSSQYTLDDGTGGLALTWTLAGADDWAMIVAAFNPSNGAVTHQQAANATAVGVGVVSTIATHLRTLAATAIGVGIAGTITTRYRTFAATATGVAVMSRVATFYRTVTATATGVGTVTKKMFKTIAATAIGIAVSVQNIPGTMTYYVTATATAVGVGFVSLNFIPQFIRSKFKKATGKNAFFGTIRRMGEANKKTSTGKPGVLQSILRKLGGGK